MAEPQPTNEQWRPIPGHEGRYEASDKGNVRSLDRTVPYRDSFRTVKGKILRPGTKAKGHKYVFLGRGNSQHVHRLVYSAFNGPIKDGDIVRHLNDDPSDNRIENLAAGDHSDNSYDCVRNGHHWWAKRSHCKYGHELTEDNIYRDPSRPSARNCRTCRREGWRRRMLARKNAA